MIGKYVYGLLGHAAVYLALQKAFGADRLRRLCVDILSPQAQERILDIGCGPAYILDYMPSVTYHGFDTEYRYIKYAKRKYCDRALAQFYCGPFTEAHMEVLEPFDGIMCMGLLHHLPDDACHDMLNLVRKALKVGGRVVTLDPCFVHGQSAIARFVAAHDRGTFVRDEKGYLGIVQAHFAEVRHNIVHNIGRLPSTEIIMCLKRPRI